MKKFNGFRTQRFPSKIAPTNKTGLQLMLQPKMVLDYYVKNEEMQKAVINSLDALQSEGVELPDQINIMVHPLVWNNEVWTLETLKDRIGDFETLMALEAKTEYLLTETKAKDSFQAALNRLAHTNQMIRDTRKALHMEN